MIAGMLPFIDKLRASMRTRRSRLCLSLDLQIPDTPLPLLEFDEPMLPFARATIAATHDIVAAYQIRPLYFLAEGGSGAIALERLVRLIPKDLPIIVDLRLDGDAPVNLAGRAAFYQCHGDAVTAQPHLRAADLAGLAGFDGGGRGLFAHLDAPTHALEAPWDGYSVSARRPELATAARQRNPHAMALIQETDAVSATALGALSDANALLAVGRSVLYASKYLSFAEDMRAALVRLNTRFPA